MVHRKFWIQRQPAQKTILLDGLNLLEHGVHVSLVIPRLHVKEDVGLEDWAGLDGFFVSTITKIILIRSGSTIE